MVSTCGCKKRHKKDMCLQEIGLCVQNVLTILGSMVNMWVEGGAFHVHVNFHFDNDSRFSCEL